MNWHLLPQGMRDRPQWIVANDNKEPMDAKTGQQAKVDDPTTWATFAEATKAAIWSGQDIGYVLSEDDPYAIIDLDNKVDSPAPMEMLRIHHDLIQRSDTYIERSVSGTGTHIIVLGKPPRPIKTAHVEVYGKRRMMVCTGDMIKEYEPAEGGELLALLDKYFGNDSIAEDKPTTLSDYAEDEKVEDDDVVMRRAWDAGDGYKFQMLWQGDKSEYGDDWSKADMALLNLLCFYTPHNAQVKRLFKRSKLYRAQQRNRQDKYMNYAIAKWRAENQPVDVSALRFPTMDDPNPPHVEPMPQRQQTALKSDHLPLPPGIVGEIAKYCYDASYRPIAEASVATAICYVSGLIGRGYHIAGRGPNQYAVFLADSGVGKEGAKGAIRRLNSALALKIPALHGAISSGDFGSGVAMVKALADNPSHLALSGEIGDKLKLMLDPRAPSHLIELKAALTEAWSESGPDGVLASRKYSDRAKNASDVASPCLSYLGESTPGVFYGAMTSGATVDGFLPRFLVFHYTGDRPKPNRNKLTTVPEDLIQRLGDVYIAAKSAQDHGQMIGVGFTDDAWTVVCAHEEMVDDRVRNESVGSPLRAILNRTHEKARRLMCLYAACENPYTPIITPEMASSAIEMIERCDAPLIEKFRDGEVAPASSGEGEGDFLDLVRKAVSAYISYTPEQRITRKCPIKLASLETIPHSYLADWLRQRAAVRNHRMGSLWATKSAIQQALDNGVLVELGKQDCHRVGANQKLYRVTGD